MDIITPPPPKDRKGLRHSSSTNPSPNSSFRNKKNLCLALLLTLLLLLLVILLLVILGFTVFKPKQVITTINSVDLKGLKISPDVLKMRLDLNVTLLVNLSVKNPNKVGFRYGNHSTALLYYKDDVVGQALIPAGKISPGGKTAMNATLTLLADRLLSNSGVYSDVIMDGMLPLTTYTKISGRVSVLKIIKHHLVSYTWCDLTLDISNRTVANWHCRYKTKL